ncbi:MAG: PqqD family protein [Bacteroidota bacterium]
MKLKKNIALSDSGFIFDPGTGNSFTTNPIGLQMIQLLKQEKTPKEIEAEIRDEYQIDAITFEKDYFDFISVLAKLKLLE